MCVPVRTVLANGTTVVAGRLAGSGTAAVCVTVGAGSRDDPQGRPGLAHLMEHLFFAGRGDRGVGEADEHRDPAAGWGGFANAGTRPDHTEFHTAIPVAGLRRLLDLEADRLAEPVLTELSVARQIRVLDAEVQSFLGGQPYGGFPFRQLTEAMLPGHRLGHDGYGSAQTLDGTSLGEVQEFRSRFYRPERTVVTVYGDIDPDETLAWAAMSFGRWAGSDPAPAQQSRPRPETVGGPSDAVNRPAPRSTPVVPTAAPLPALAIGVYLPSASVDLHGYVHTLVALTLLDERPGSSGARCGLAGPLGAAHPDLGALTVVVGSDDEPAAVESRLLATLSELADREPAAEELEAVVAPLHTEQLVNAVLPLARSRSAATHLSLFDDLHLDERVGDILLRLTPSDISAAAGRLHEGPRVAHWIQPVGRRAS